MHLLPFLHLTPCLDEQDFFLQSRKKFIIVGPGYGVLTIMQLVPGYPCSVSGYPWSVPGYAGFVPVCPESVPGCP